jgi:hypothetical protein
MVQLWYPKADNRTQNFSRAWPGDIMPHTNVFLLHSTEGGDWPTYDGGAIAPSITYKRQSRQFRQHFPANMSARALRNDAGGVETNTLNVFQIEIIGTCDPAMKGKMHDAQGRTAMFVPEMDDEAIDDLAHLWLWLHVNFAVPLTALAPERWWSYPKSYGATDTRMGGAEWTAFTGVCGHQHAPENVHGDPGNIPIGKLLARVVELDGGGPPPPPPPHAHPLADEWQRTTGDAVRAGQAFIKAYPGYPAFARLVEQQQAEWRAIYNLAH